MTLSEMPAAVSMIRKSKSSRDLVERLAEPVPLAVGQRGQLRHAGAGRNDLHAARPLRPAISSQCRSRRSSTWPMWTAGASPSSTSTLPRPKSASRIADPVAQPRQRDGEVDGDVGLADAALAAGDGNADEPRRRRESACCHAALSARAVAEQRRGQVRRRGAQQVVRHALPDAQIRHLQPAVAQHATPVAPMTPLRPPWSGSARSSRAPA